MKRLGEAAGVDVDDYAGYLAALEERRRYFVEHGAVSADHGHADAIAAPLERGRGPAHLPLGAGRPGVRAPRRPRSAGT